MIPTPPPNGRMRWAFARRLEPTLDTYAHGDFSGRMQLTAAGVAIGLGATFAVTRLLSWMRMVWAPSIR